MGAAEPLIVVSWVLVGVMTPTNGELTKPHCEVHAARVWMWSGRRTHCRIPSFLLGLSIDDALSVLLNRSRYSVVHVACATPCRGPSALLTRALAPLPHTVVGLPALSPTMTQGNIAGHVASVGDELTVGDRIAEIETDKATVDFEMTDDGVLAKILLPEGSADIPVGTPMLVMVEDKADVAAFADFTADAAPPPAAEPAAAAPAAPAAPTPAAAPAAPAPAAAAAPASAPPVAVAGGPRRRRVAYWNPEKGWFRA